MRASLAATLAVTIMAVTTPVHAKPELLQPAGKWVVNYAEAQCAVTRAYGSGENQRTLVLRMSVGGGVLQAALVAKGGTFSATENSVKLGLSDGQELDVMELRYGLHDNAFRLVNLGGEQREAFANTATLRWGSDRDAFVLPLDQLNDVLAVLEHCRKDLRIYWNVDEEVRATFQRKVNSEKPLVSYISDDDYPGQAIRNEQGGATSFVLLVDEKGALKDCMVEATSGDATLDIMSCIVFSKRAKFIPALDKNGKPVRSVMYSKVKWVFPD